MESPEDVECESGARRMSGAREISRLHQLVEPRVYAGVFRATAEVELGGMNAIRLHHGHHLRIASVWTWLSIVTQRHSMTPTVYCRDVMLHKKPEPRTPDVCPVKGIILVVFDPAGFT
jgi:hypothetical protein